MDFETQIPDYLNGHLTEEEQALFETQLRDDSVLAAQVAAERELQNQMRRQAPRQASPQFDSIRGRLSPKPWWTNSVTWPATTAIALILVLGLTNFQLPTEHNEFRTLSAPAIMHEEPVVRIVLHDYNELENLVNTHALKFLRNYPTAHAVDVAANSVPDEVRKKLASDQRVRLLQFLESGKL